MVPRCFSTAPRHVLLAFDARGCWRCVPHVAGRSTVSNPGISVLLPFQYRWRVVAIAKDSPWCFSIRAPCNFVFLRVVVGAIPFATHNITISRNTEDVREFCSDHELSVWHLAEAIRIIFCSVAGDLSHCTVQGYTLDIVCRPRSGTVHRLC